MISTASSSNADAFTSLHLFVFSCCIR